MRWPWGRPARGGEGRGGGGQQGTVGRVEGGQLSNGSTCMHCCTGRPCVGHCVGGARELVGHDKWRTASISTVVTLRRGVMCAKVRLHTTRAHLVDQSIRPAARKRQSHRSSGRSRCDGLFWHTALRTRAQQTASGSMLCSRAHMRARGQQACSRGHTRPPCQYQSPVGRAIETSPRHGVAGSAVAGSPPQGRPLPNHTPPLTMKPRCLMKSQLLKMLTRVVMPAIHAGGAMQFCVCMNFMITTDHI